MKKICLTLLITPLLMGCTWDKNGNQANGDSLLDYQKFEDRHLQWKDLFSPAKSQYFVYIYSLFCGHCENIKHNVLSVVNERKEDFYLINYADEIPIGTNAYETIGKEKIEEVFILGTPTLIGVNNQYISLNIAGEKDILDYLKLLPHNICY